MLIFFNKLQLVFRIYKIQFFIVLIIAFTSSQSIYASTPSVTLIEAYAFSLKNAETVQIQQSQSNQASQQVSQAKGGFLPTIAASATYLKQDVPSSSSSIEQDQTTAKLTLSQPLFRGLGSFATLKASKAYAQAKENLVELEKATLYQNCATLFYRTLELEKDHSHLEDLLNFTQERIKDLKERERIGKSKTSEVLAAQSQFALFKSQTLEAAFKASISKKEFLSLTRLPENTILIENLNPIQTLPSLDFYLKQLNNRPDILALQNNLDASQSLVTVARAGHFPSLDIYGNYYFKRTGTYKDSKWDASLGLSIPLFAGGVTHSKILEATEKTKESELSLFYAQRKAKDEITAYYAQVQNLIQQVDLLKEASIIAKKSYDTQKRDYQYGLVSNLDVLQSLSNRIETERSLDKSIYELQIAYASIQSAINEIPKVEKVETR